ncbi:glycosyltransferase family 2 protein [uncultured Christiangramia sp.]|uniref:glycosyltransferase family 2 protein n=1 Tax=uncultured Christiangramia sp. TaxID=503836 RepID=UPI0026295FF7|nr:glycosyltransferase family 2 protein [uncultured Christiangramia sp.]
MKKGLVSIIIPTYNRSHLIGETLDSVIAQTYQNWECIVVDDGSNDYTEELLEFYCEEDDRIRFYSRPPNKLKGANACRNYGFEHSTGEYVNWFDSDDLMTSNFILIKVNAIRGGSYDFCISKTKYFNLEVQDEFYEFNSEDVSSHNYITQKVNWLTYDAFIKRAIAKKISFNESLQSGQEFNYFAKLTCLTAKVIIIDEYLTLRRFHLDSIRGNLRYSKDNLLRSKYATHWATYNNLKLEIKKETRIYLIQRCILFFFNFKNYYKSFDVVFFIAIWRELDLSKAVYYCLANLINALTGKGYFFVKKVRHI